MVRAGSRIIGEGPPRALRVRPELVRGLTLIAGRAAGRLARQVSESPQRRASLADRALDRQPPPDCATRSCRPRMPVPRESSAPPTPSSPTSTRRVDPSHWRRCWPAWPTRTSRRSASASDTTKYAVASTAGESLRSGTELTTAGTVERSARALIAAPSPASVRIAGWMPRASSRELPDGDPRLGRGFIGRSDRLVVWLCACPKASRRSRRASHRETRRC